MSHGVIGFTCSWSLGLSQSTHPNLSLSQHFKLYSLHEAQSRHSANLIVFIGLSLNIPSMLEPSLPETTIFFYPILYFHSHTLFFWPKFFWPQIFFCTQNFLDQKFFWPKFLWTLIFWTTFFWTTTFLDLIFFYPKLFWPKVFWTWIFFNQNFFGPNFF